MLNLLSNITTGALKVATGVVFVPVALVADLVTLPASAEDPRRGPFDKTGQALGLIGDGIDDATKGDA